MKAKLQITFTTLLLLFLYGCSNGLDSKYFGSLPGTLNELLERRIEAQAKFDKKAESRTWDSEYSELFRELSGFDPLLNEQIKELSPSIIGTQIPIEISNDLPYTISKAAVISEIPINHSSLSLSFKISFNLTLTSDVVLSKSWTDGFKLHDYEPIYLKFVDENGTLIYQCVENDCLAGTARPKQESRKVLPANKEVSVQFSYDFKSYREEMEDVEQNKKLASLDKIVIITKDEYDNNKELVSR